MSTYTVLQDIEAEDKLLGPLTLRQFIYAGITVALLFIAFAASKVSPFLGIPFVLPALVFGFLSAPWGKDQPTETWAVAKVRFFFKPRKRIWNQTGQKDLVEITVPKKENIRYTDGLTQHEVRSRLEALASTIDSRGWVIKNSSAQQAQMPVVFGGASADSDRLTGAPSLPQAVPEYGNEPIYDVLDEANSPVSQQITQMITASESAHRQQIIDRMNAPTPAEASSPVAQAQQPWFTGPAQTQGQVAAKDPSASELALLQTLHEQEELEKHLSKSHLKTIQPLSEEPALPPPVLRTPTPAALMAVGNTEELSTDAKNGGEVAFTPSAPTANAIDDSQKTAVTPAADPGILELSRNDDLDVATIARQVRRKPQDEVVISLH